VAGGGTGGHLYPGLAVAAELRRRGPANQVSFIGTRRGIEHRLVPADGYPLRYIAIRGFLGKSIAGKLAFPFLFAWSVCQSLFYMIADRPDVLLGTGGYVSAPPVLAAWLLRVPVGLLALDAMPSRAVRLLAGCAAEIYSGFPECAESIRPKRRVIFTGNPLRPEIGSVSRSDGAARFGLDHAQQTILLFGGSQGAHSLNTAMIDTLKAKANDRRWRELQFIVQTGTRDCARARTELAAMPMKVVVLPYIGNMPAAFAASDLVVSRSGSSVSETLACGLPSILVPFPHAASNHQEHNARSLERGGAAVVILERDLTAERLAAAVEAVLFDHRTQRSMRRSAADLARSGAAGMVTQRLLGLTAT